MDWLWLLLGVAGLGLLWLLIKWLERLTSRLKMREEVAKQKRADLDEKIAAQEKHFMRVQAAKDYITNMPSDPEITDDTIDPKDVPQEFKDAISFLSGEELLDAMVQRAFGNPQDNMDRITASQSAFAQEPTRMVMAGSDGVQPVKAKSASKNKSVLSRSEKKIYKKIQQGG